MTRGAHLVDRTPRPEKVSSACTLGRHYGCYKLNCTCPCHRTVLVAGRSDGGK